MSEKEDQIMFGAKYTIIHKDNNSDLRILALTNTLQTAKKCMIDSGYMDNPKIGIFEIKKIEAN